VESASPSLPEIFKSQWRLGSPGFEFGRSRTGEGSSGERKKGVV
jgi:hypothetical protein